MRRARTAPAGDARRPTGVTLVILLGALSAFAPLSIDMYLPSLPAIADDLHTTSAAVQLTLTACLVGLAVGQLLAGPVSDSLGRRAPLLVGVTAYAVASGLCVVAPSVTVLILLRFVQGIGGAAGIVIARAIVRDLYTGVAAVRFFSSLLLVAGAAPVCAPVIGAQLLRFGSWRVVFVVLAAIGLVLCVSAAVRLPETLAQTARDPSSLRMTLRTLRRIVADRRFLGYVLAGGLGFSAMFAYISGSPFVLEQLDGLSPQLFSVFFAVNAASLVAAGQSNRLLVGRVSAQRLLNSGLVAMTAGAVALLVLVVLGHHEAAAVMPCFVVVVGSLGFVMPNATALALADHARTAGSASALIGVIQFVSGAGVAPLVGVGGARSALPMAVVIAVAAGAALLTRLCLAPSAGRRGDAGAQAVATTATTV